MDIPADTPDRSAPGSPGGRRGRGFSRARASAAPSAAVRYLQVTRVVAIVSCLVSLVVPAIAQASGDIAKITFGSCARQNRPIPILDTIRADEPDAFLFIGDNVYADFYGMPAVPLYFWLAYGQLAARPEYQRLAERIPIRAIWDDHDYGTNDGGSNYAGKGVAKAFFVDFFSFAPDHPVHSHEGAYYSEILGRGERSVQLIFLDTRTFRSELNRAELTDDCPVKHLVPSDGPEATILGEAQWRWLEAQLQVPAGIRLLVSSTQVIPTEHCVEKWANFPRERDRLFALLEKHRIVNLVILSGDRHFGEISRIDPPQGGPPLYEITASGLNTAGTPREEANSYRVSSGRIGVDHYGRILFDWQEGKVALELVDEERQTLERKVIAIP